MSSVELWSCDWHANPPTSDADYVNEDTCLDEGWTRIERTVDLPSALGAGKTWRHHEVNHVCPECLKDPECREWIEDGGFAPMFSDDAERIKAAA